MKFNPLIFSGFDSSGSSGGGGSGMAIGSPVSSGTSGSILLVDGSGNLAQDNPNLFWDINNHRLGIGTNTPNRNLTINDASGNVYLDFQQNGVSQFLFGSDSTATFVMFNLLLSQYGLLQNSVGQWGMGRVAPTPSAWLTLQAGAAAAGEAPLKITAGTNLTTPEEGAIEFDGTNLYYSDNKPSRWSLVPQNNSSGAVITVDSSGGAPANYLQITDPNIGDIWTIDPDGSLHFQANASPTYAITTGGFPAQFWNLDINGNIKANAPLILTSNSNNSVQTVANGDSLDSNSSSNMVSSAGAVSTSTSTVINPGQVSQVLTIVNVGSNSITLKSGGNVELPGLTDYVLTAKSSISLIYWSGLWYTTGVSVN